MEDRRGGESFAIFLLAVPIFLVSRHVSCEPSLCAPYYAPLHKAVRGVQPIPKDKVTLRNCFPWDEAKLALAIFSFPSFRPPPRFSRFPFLRPRRFPRLYHFALPPSLPRSCPLPSVEMRADKRRRRLKGRKNAGIRAFASSHTVEHRLFRYDNIFAPLLSFSRIVISEGRIEQG